MSATELNPPVKSPSHTRAQPSALSNFLREKATQNKVFITFTFTNTVHVHAWLQNVKIPDSDHLPKNLNYLIPKAIVKIKLNKALLAIACT